MMKIAGKWIVLLLTVAMLSGIIPSSLNGVWADASETESVEDVLKIPCEGVIDDSVFWTIDDYGELVISGEGSIGDYDDIERPWESLCDEIRGIIVQAGIQSIGNYAFSGCSSLETVTIAETVSAIGDYVFSQDSELRKIVFEGDMPVFGAEGMSFYGVSAAIYYPLDNSSWEGVENIYSDEGLLWNNNSGQSDDAMVDTQNDDTAIDEDFPGVDDGNRETHEDDVSGDASTEWGEAAGHEEIDKQGIDNTEENEQEQTVEEDDSVTGGEQGLPSTGNTADSDLNKNQDKKILIVNVDNLETGIRFQHLQLGAQEAEIAFPQELLVEGKESKTSHSGEILQGNAASDAEDLNGEKGEKTEGVVAVDIQWRLDPERSSGTVFDSSSDGQVYVYYPVFPQQYTVSDQCSLPAITVGVGILSTPVAKRKAKATSAGRNETGFIAAIDDADASAIKISTAEELSEVGNDPYGSYVLTKDIDLSGFGNWTPIGTTNATAFHGKLDGQGHTIRGLKVDISFDSGALVSPSYVAGLFGVCEGAQIKNLSLENANISIETTSGYHYTGNVNSEYGIYAGSIAGYACESTVLFNCRASGTVQAKASGEGYSPTMAGGLIGAGDTIGISYSYNLCEVQAYNGNAVQAYDSMAGGLIGRVTSEGVIEKSFNGGGVTSRTLDYGNAYAGGLSGECANSQMNIQNAFNEGTVQSQAGNMFSDSSFAGGIAGTLDGNVQYVYNSGSVVSQATDPYGINNNAQSYAGGICGKCASSASVQDSAVLHSTVSAGSAGTRFQYRISSGGSKSDNITVSSVTSGSTNDADIIKDAPEMEEISPYVDILGWDFSKIWEFVEGKAYPQLKQQDVNSEEYDQEYIEQHLEFIEGETYANILEQNRWAQIYWSEENNFKSNLAGALYNGIDTAINLASLNFKELFDENNPFKIILADYVSDQSTVDEIKTLANRELPYSMDAKYKKAKAFIKKNWSESYGDLSDEDLFWLEHYEDQSAEEWISQNFEDHLFEIAYDDKGEKLESLFEASSKAIDQMISLKDKYNSTVSWFNAMLKYSAEVDAYVKADSEFREILEEMCVNLPVSSQKYPSQLREALESYTRYDNEENVKEAALTYFLAQSAESQIAKKVQGFFQKKTNEWLKSALSPDALSAYNTIIKAAGKTWKVMNYVTKNGELQECREMLRANAYFEDTMYKALKVFEGRLRSQKRYDDACMFDTAFKFFKETEIASMDIVIEYLNTYQMSWFAAIRNGTNSFNNSAIEEVHVNKLFLYNTYCHGTSFSLGGKVITIACPTNVYVYDQDHTLRASIEDGKVTRSEGGVLAYTADSIKLIAVPLDQEYGLHIDATDDGFMNYSVSEYNGDKKVVQETVYSNISIQKGEEFVGKVNAEIETDPDNYNLTGEDETPLDGYELIVNETNIPVESLQIKTDTETLRVGQNLQLKTEILPENATVRTAAWSSSDENVIGVSDTGEVTAFSAGTATIYAQSLYGGVIDSVEFVVLEEGQKLYIKKQPVSAEYFAGEKAEPLFVEADITGGETLSYQWYRAEKEDLSDADILDGENASSLSINTASTGISYYYAVISSGGETARSKAAKVTITDRPPLAEGKIGNKVLWSLSADYVLSIYGEGEAVLTDDAAEVPWQEHTSSIREIIVGDGITKIDEGLFAGCSGLEKIEVPFVGVSEDTDGEERVFGAVFGRVSNGGTVQYYELEGTSLHGYRYDIPGNLQEVQVTNAAIIPFGAFSNCGGIQSITLNDGITEIAQYGFYNCNGLKALSIPDSTQVIQEGALAGCTGLTALDIPFVGVREDSSGTSDAVFGAIFGKSSQGTVQFYSLDGTSLSGYSYAIPDELEKVSILKETEIPLGAFSNCSQIREIKLNSGITKIGLYAFYNCSGLTDIYYDDFESIWNSIDRNASGNDALDSATLHCIQDMKVIGHSLSLLGNIGVNYYICLDDAVILDDGAFIQFTLPDGSIEKLPVKGTGTREVNGRNCRQFSCEIASTQMTGDILAELVRSDGKKSAVDHYSAKTYADRIIENRDGNEAFEKAKPLVVRMLCYGGYAQKYFQYDDAPLASADLSTEETNLDSVTEDVLEGYAYTQKGNQEGVAYYGTSLVLKSETSIRHYFSLEGGHSIEEYIFKNGTQEIAPIKYGKYYYVEIPNIASDELDTMYNVTVGDFSINYGALSYAWSKMKKAETEESLRNLLKAMYLYNQEANTYFGG